MKRILSLALIAIIMTMGTCIPAEEFFPKPGWVEMADPIAAPDAVAGGEMSMHGGPSPHSLNYLLDNNTFSSMVFGLMYETLLGADSLTMEETPLLAEKWSISDDKKVFTFWMNPKARWSDGRAISAEDVKWSFETIMDPLNLTGPHKVALERFEKVELPGDNTVRFVAKDVHWANLEAAGSMPVLPKHAYEGKDFNLINFEFPVVSGPYRLKEVKAGVHVLMERREDWWYRQSPAAKGIYNFDSIKFRIFESSENAYEGFLQGQIDVFPVYTSRQWINETVGERFQRNWIVKQKIQNYNPVGFQGFAMNMRRFPFDDVRVRQAMCHLIDRAKMNSTLMYDQYFLHRSYFEDLYGPENPCPNPLIPFDKAKARQILADAGWKANAQTGVLEKDGKEMRFRFLNRDQSSMKFINIFQQDLKDVGVTLEADLKDSAAWTKDMDEFNYQMTWASWAVGVKKDPESMWSSKEADRVSGNNITGFKNPRVDELIEQTKTIFDIGARHELVRQIDQIAYTEYPYALLWNINYARLLYWNKFGTPSTVLSKFGSTNSAVAYWWFDEDSAADLEDAQKTGGNLPARPFEVDFDKTFKGK